MGSADCQTKFELGTEWGKTQMLYFASRQTYAYLKLSFFCEFIWENVVNAVIFQGRTSSSSCSTPGFCRSLDQENIACADLQPFSVKVISINSITCSTFLHEQWDTHFCAANLHSGYLGNSSIFSAQIPKGTFVPSPRTIPSPRVNFENGFAIQWITSLLFGTWGEL